EAAGSTSRQRGAERETADRARGDEGGRPRIGFPVEAEQLEPERLCGESEQPQREHQEQRPTARAAARSRLDRAASREEQGSAGNQRRRSEDEPEIVQRP